MSNLLQRPCYSPRAQAHRQTVCSEQVERQERAIGGRAIDATRSFAAACRRSIEEGGSRLEADFGGQAVVEADVCSVGP